MLARVQPNPPPSTLPARQSRRRQMLGLRAVRHTTEAQLLLSALDETRPTVAPAPTSCIDVSVEKYLLWATTIRFQSCAEELVLHHSGSVSVSHLRRTSRRGISECP